MSGTTWLDGEITAAEITHTIGDLYTWCWDCGIVRGQHDCTQEEP